MPAKTRLKTREHHLLEYHPPAQLRPDERNAREHPRKQIVKLRRAISEFGFLNPILADENLKVIGGHARLEAALEEKLDVVPVIRLAGLSEASKIAIAISDNQLGDLSTFDESRLSELLRNLEAVEFDVELTGFDTGEIDRLLLPVLGGGGADDAVSPDENASAVSRVGDLWLLGQHRLYCGDALETASYDALLGSERAAFIFADPPYNVPVNGHISGLGKHRHREFLNASGELSRPEFMSFLSKAMAAMASFSTDGALHANCMDWRHMSEVLEAGDKAYASLQALCVWDKQSAGMGSLWRSQHELVFVFKNGSAPHQNNVSLGIHGRYRTNIWSYPGLAGLRKRSQRGARGAPDRETG